jgi:hypothetical protein
MNRDYVLTGNLGSVQVWMGNPGNSFSVYACDGHHRMIQLFDQQGKSISPKSPRLGYSGRRGSWEEGIQLVCDDDVSEDTFNRLVAAGYPNVCRRG